ncbi:MAG TPA: 50S ribosomal protein L29 [Acidimicrobiales bacterium]|nr:50S ribosomal protein L29 [Acidimicrobiales bacterium]
MPSAAQALRDLTDAELASQLADAKEELFTLRFQLATGRQDNSARVGQVKKNIARISTLLREREIQAAEALATEVK